jgi:hypothetical protein
MIDRTLFSVCNDETVADRRAEEPEHQRRRHHPRSQEPLRADRKRARRRDHFKKADNHWAEIKSGKVTYRIVGMPDRGFPKVPDHPVPF